MASRYTGKVIGGSLNLRKSESTSSTSLASIPNGTTLEVQSWNEDDWFRTIYDGKEGYVMARYIALTNTGRTCWVNTSSTSLNIRQTPSTSATAIYTAAKDSTLSYLYTSYPWHRVSSNQGTGWAHGDYIVVNP